MADQGIDAISHGSIVYQVKWSSKVLRNPQSWLGATIAGERDKIVRLVREKQISRYILLTSVAGTTTARGTGSIQKLQSQLDEYTAEFGIPVECWWQSDIDAEVDAAPDALKWSYQEMLAGADAMRYLIYGSQVEGQAARMRDTVLQVMATQWWEDSKIKFSQVDLDRVNITDLFVDVCASLQASPRNAIDELTSVVNDRAHRTLGAVEHMLRTSVPLTYLLGVPGQGKSTLSQYLAQVHRAAILPVDKLRDRTPPHETVDDPKLPLRIDLKDYAAWLSGIDPFGDDDPPKNPKRRKKAQRSVEFFLARFCEAMSGGRDVRVDDVQSLLGRYPTLLILDGLDEVADPELRAIIVEQINFTATRMGSTRLRKFQILVTARPNASGLAEPDRDIFQTLRLEPMTPELQREFVGKWCEVNGIRGKERRDLRRTFLDRTALDHVAQLADNPMQLTILLFLINRKGDAVPVARTPLYTDYMTTLLDREVIRHQIEREQVPRVQEVTAFLGWHMHSGVEGSPEAGRMSRRDIETTLILYFRLIEGPFGEVENLFAAASDRFWALTSKVDGTFEFAVQPVREYFAAKFLAEWAGRDRRESLPKQDVLRHLIQRPYWLNTARFYAGFAPPNELAGLRYGLEDAIESGQHPLQERAAAWALLSDGIFTHNVPVQRDVVKLLTDDLTVTLIAHESDAAITFPRLAHASGGDQMTTALLADLAADPAHPLAGNRIDVLRDHAGLDRETFTQWWLTQLLAAIATPAQNAWLHLGGRFGVPRLQSDDANHLRLASATDYQAALAAGATPDTGTEANARLLRAVLDGHCSDVATTSSAEAGSLLRAMRPQWWHQFDQQQRVGPPLANEHLWLDQRDRSSRASTWNSLTERDPRYQALKNAAKPRGRGQKGTTEPWQAPARELARLHGPCWLAAEIAIAGAATTDTVASGSIDLHGEPFGPNLDYGTFVIEVRRRPKSEWWRTMHDRYDDSLSRRTWAVALLATASADIIAEHLAQIDGCLESLTDDDYLAVAATSSRIGITQRHRRLPSDVWASAQMLKSRTKLLLAHFTADLSALDPLPHLADSELAELANPHPSAWPIVRAVGARLLSTPTTTVFEALTKLSSDSDIEFPHTAKTCPSAEQLDTMLADPARFPGGWVVAAEALRAVANEVPLEETAISEEWLPQVPRLQGAASGVSRLHPADRDQATEGRHRRPHSRRRRTT